MLDNKNCASGFLELRTSFEVKGWAYVAHENERPTHVDIIHNEKVIGIALANIFRGDLRRKGIGDGRHGFRFTSDSAIENPNQIIARVRETGHILTPLRAISSLIQPRIVSSRYGNIWTTSREDLISRALEKYGEWGLPEVELVVKLSHNVRHLWDIGAYLGTFSFGIPNVEKIVYVEANTAIIPLLVENVGSFSLSRLSFVHNSAVGRPSGKFAGIRMHNADNVGASAVIDGSETGALKVPWVKLSELGEIFGIPDLIKLDVEGHEAGCIEESAEWLKQYMPELWVECNESHDAVGIFEILKRIGYKVYYFSSPAWNDHNFKGVKEDMFGGIHEAGLFCTTRCFSEMEIGQLSGWRGISRKILDADALRAALWATPRRWRGELVLKRPFELLALADRGDLSNFDDFLR